MNTEISIINISGVDCYEKDGVAYLRLETVARGLGFTDKKGDVEYVRWNRVDGFLKELNFATCGERPKYIPENIFYRLAMKAKSATAEAFQAKIADEVIPMIRKTGGYVNNEQQFIDTYLPFADEGTKALFGQTLVALKSANQKIEADKPKVLFADAVTASDTSILVGELAKLIKQNGVDIGQNRLFTWMRNKGYLTKSNAPTQRSMELELFEVMERTINNPDGSVKITRTTKVTGKGQQYFINKFLTGGAV